jgi:hypothetical protein
MKKSKFQNIESNLLPKREEYLNSQQLVVECEKLNMPISRKTIHNYIKEGILPRPLHVAKEALFHKEFVLGEIGAIHSLRSLFHVTHSDLKKLANNKYVDLHHIASAIYSKLSDLQETHIGKLKNRPFLVNIANEKVFQGLASLYLEKVKNGDDPRQIDMEKLVDRALAK